MRSSNSPGGKNVEGQSPSRPMVKSKALIFLLERPGWEERMPTGPDRPCVSGPNVCTWLVWMRVEV